MRMDSIPKETSIRSAFGEVEVEYSLDANILLATKTIYFTLSRIPPENYADFLRFRERLLARGQTAISRGQDRALISSCFAAVSQQ
jgi:hypothetical protein